MSYISYCWRSLAQALVSGGFTQFPDVNMVHVIVTSSMGPPWTPSGAHGPGTCILHRHRPCAGHLEHASCIQTVLGHQAGCPTISWSGPPAAFPTLLTEGSFPSFRPKPRTVLFFLPLPSQSVGKHIGPFWAEQRLGLPSMRSPPRSPCSLRPLSGHSSQSRWIESLRALTVITLPPSVCAQTSHAQEAFDDPTVRTVPCRLCGVFFHSPFSL